jgi:hypothetical protein
LIGLGVKLFHGLFSSQPVPRLNRHIGGDD